MAVPKKAVEAMVGELAREMGVTPLDRADFEKQSRSAAFYGEPGPLPSAKAWLGALKRRERERRQRRERLLLGLANISLDGIATSKPLPFQLKKTFEAFGFAPLAFEAVALSQKALQSIWPREVLAVLKQQVIDLFLIAATKQPPHPFGGLYALLPSSSVEFGESNFPGQVVIAILENWWRMAKCGNPECPTPYFLAKRSTQCYCERGECTRYALRKKAKKWWSENRAKKGE